MNRKNKLYTISMFTMEEEPEQYTFVKWTVLYALATRKHIGHYINRIYDANRIDYYQAFKESEFMNINLSLFTTETSDRMIKVGGIMAWSQEHNDYQYFFSLIDKGYKFAWNFLKRHKRMNLPDFYKDMRKIVHPDESNFQAVIGMYVSSLMGYEVVVDIYDTDENIKDEMEGSSIAMANILKFANTNYEIMVRDSSFQLDELDEETQNYLKEMMSHWGMKSQENPTLMKFIKDIKDREIEEMGIEQYRGREYFDQLDKATRDALFSGKSRLFTVLQLWLEIEGISWYDLFENYTLTKKEVEKLAYFFQKGLEKELILEEEQELIFAYTVILSALNESYLKAKSYQIENRVEEGEYQAKEREGKLVEKWQNKEKRWKEEEQKRKEELKNYRREKGALQAEAKELRKQLALQEAELEKGRQSQKELQAMERLQHLQEEVENSTTSLEEMEKFLQEKQVIVIGGHPTWQAKLKEKFPHFILWEADDVTKDLTPLDHADAVCIYWTYLSHPMYWKVKKRMNNNNTSLFFLERTTNLEKTVEEIYYSF